MKDVFEKIERPFTFETKSYSSKAEGNILITQEAFLKMFFKVISTQIIVIISSIHDTPFY